MSTVNFVTSQPGFFVVTIYGWDKWVGYIEYHLSSVVAWKLEDGVAFPICVEEVDDNPIIVSPDGRVTTYLSWWDDIESFLTDPDEIETIRRK